MEQYISKAAVKAAIKERLKHNGTRAELDRSAFMAGREKEDEDILALLDTLDVKEVDLELENENNNPKITAGTKIRLKTNPDVILNIISTDCHEDEFECSNGSVLSLKQIEKYYDIIT